MNALSFEDRQAVLQTLTAAAAHWTPRQRAIVGLYWGAGWTQARIGERLGISQAAVSQQWKRALRVSHMAVE